jgi:hypothetical protein
MPIIANNYTQITNTYSQSTPIPLEHIEQFRELYNRYPHKVIPISEGSERLPVGERVRGSMVDCWV